MAESMDVDEQPGPSAAEKGKAALHPGMKPAQPAQPRRRGFTAAQLQVSSSDDELDIVEGDTSGLEWVASAGL